uniref:PH domain-containing protein n=1 Tax=Macrostomum lignano TaxID=282301 RepID=A0A1I8JNM3_9PLAT
GRAVPTRTEEKRQFPRGTSSQKSSSHRTQPKSSSNRSRTSARRAVSTRNLSQKAVQSRYLKPRKQFQAGTRQLEEAVPTGTSARRAFRTGTSTRRAVPHWNAQPEQFPREQFSPEPQPEEQFPPKLSKEQFSLEPQPEEQFLTGTVSAEAATPRCRRPPIHPGSQSSTSPSTEFDSLDPDLAGLTTTARRHCTRRADLAGRLPRRLWAARRPAPPAATRTAGLARAAHAEGRDDEERGGSGRGGVPGTALTALPSPPPAAPPLEATPLPLLGHGGARDASRRSASHQNSDRPGQDEQQCSAVEAAVAEEVLVEQRTPTPDVNADIDASDRRRSPTSHQGLSQPAAAVAAAAAAVAAANAAGRRCRIGADARNCQPHAESRLRLRSRLSQRLEERDRLVELSGPDCPVRSVTVYLDKAEVSASSSCALGPRDRKWWFETLTAAIDGDSV